MRTFFDVALALVLVDLTLVVLSGGVSILGAVGPAGFLLRVAVALALVALRSRLPKPTRAYLVLLLLLLPLLHFRGFRLRGDGLWYYSYAHSLAFDFDLDLTNQYKRLGIDSYRGSQIVPDTGYARNTFPVGVGLLWTPLLVFGYVGAFWRNVHGILTPYDGWSDPFFHAVALGSLLIGWLGLLVLDRFLRRWFTPGVSFAATSGIALGTFLLWYLVYQAIYTHAPTFFLSALVVDLWADRNRTAKRCALLGLLVGAAACIRWQNALLGLLPLSSLGGAWRKGAPLLAGGFFVGVLPQLIAWKLIFGSFLVGVPLGESYMRLRDPFLAEVLFSSRHGLFSWSPLLIFGGVGLFGFLRRERTALSPMGAGVGPRATNRKVGLALLLLFAIQLYVNSAVADWWAGGSFGARRFDASLPILAVGLATVIEWLTRLAVRWPALLPAGVLASFVLANVLFMEQYRKGRIPTDDTISYEVAGRGMMEDVFDGVGYPFSFPANWIFTLRYGRPKTQYDLLVGKYLFHLQNNLGGVIDLGEKDAPFVGNGWSSVSDWEGRPREVRVTRDERAGILVPTDAPETLRVVVVCAALPGKGPLTVGVYLNGAEVGTFEAQTTLAEHGLVADASLWKRLNVLELAGPYLAVDRVRFERMEPPP